MSKLLALALAFVASLAAAPAPPPLVSGEYDAMVIGFEPSSGRITGYFEEGTGLDPKTQEPLFHCIFYLSGKAEGVPPWPVATWFPGDAKPEVIPGTLAPGVEGGRTVLRVKLREEHGGCWNVRHFADPEGAELDLLAPGDWKSVRVAGRRVSLRPEPSAGARRKAYVVRGDVLRVFEERQGWLLAEYVNANGKKTRGWVKAGDVFPDAPSKK